MTEIPAAPTGTGPAGRRLWSTIMAAYTLSEVEDVLLRQAVRTADHVNDLDAILTAQGLLVDGRAGEPKAHPLLAEVRQQRLVLARLLSALRLPVDGSGARTQHRSARGVYAVGVLS